MRESSVADNKALQYVIYRYVQPVNSALTINARYTELKNCENFLNYNFQSFTLSRALDSLLD